jgi:uncharacterized protein (TIGR03000 family)
LVQTAPRGAAMVEGGTQRVHFRGTTMIRRLLLLAALSMFVLAALPGPSFAQFLDRWQTWGNGYGYGRSGFDIGKPGSAFPPPPSSASWYPSHPFAHYEFYTPYYDAPAVLVAPSRDVALYPPTTVDPTRASIDIRVPADAKVFFDRSPTAQTGSDRRFVSPPLEPGRVYRYEITARWIRDGQEQTGSRTVRVEPGQTVHVDFGSP